MDWVLVSLQLRRPHQPHQIVARGTDHHLLDGISGHIDVGTGHGSLGVLSARGPRDIGFGIAYLFRIFDPSFYRSRPLAELPVLLFEAAGSVLFLWVYFATAVKRLHDRDKTAWWAIPLVAIPSFYHQLGGLAARRFLFRAGDLRAGLRFLQLGFGRTVLPQGLAEDQTVRRQSARTNRYAAALGAAERDRNGAAQGWPAAGLAC
jgi:hypothetical protein